jgi:hypothetical protein
MRKYYSNRLLNLKQQLMLWLMILSIFTLKAQVSLTATGGAATGSYTTVSQAFDSINKGFHSGDIVLTITANTTEPGAPVSLLKPGTSPYTSVKIIPSGVRTIGLTNLNANRAIIELFGARNVTIDGDDPGVAGVDRSLTIGFYSGTASFNNTSVIRIGSVATPTDSAAGITIKNCNILGPRPSTTSTSVNYGIIIGSNSTSNQLTFGARNRDIVIENNSILRCYNGIGSYSNGTTTNLFSNIIIRGNEIGITGNSNDFIGGYGIDCQGSSVAASPLIIERNQIRVGTNTTSGFNAETMGILLRPGNPSTIIRYNRLTDIMNNNSLTGAGGFIVGIFMSGADNTNIDINNNIIKDVIGARKQTANFLEANYGIYANGIGSVRLNHNTIAFNIPNYVGTGTNTVSSCLALMGSTNVLEFNNNILVNRNASTNAYCVGTMLSMAPFANTAMDKNCYFYPNGSMSNVTNPTTLANWQSLTARDQNSFIENPPFISGADLHIQTGIVTRLESNAAPSGYAFDVDLDVRANPTDIGADEFAGTAYIAPQILNVSHSPTTQSCAAATARTVQAVFSTLGNSLDSVILEYTVNGGAFNYLRMNSVSATGFTRLIPAVTPLNAIVRYRVFCVTKVGDTVFSNYNSYNDNTASRAIIPGLTSNPPQACVTSTVQLNYTYSPDPTGFIFPPNVIDTVMQTNISNVKLTTINNFTPATNSLVGSLGVASGVRGAYSNFRSFAADTMGLGRSYPVSFTASTTANVKLYLAAFVDFDGDGSFTSANETVFNTIQPRTSGTRTENFNLYIPPNAKPGKTCVRFICSHSPIVNSFFNIFRGEVEDYSIYIRPLTTVWKTGVTTIGSANPQSYTIGSLPATVYIEMTDSATCNVTSNPLSITASAAGMNVTLTAPTSACYNVPVLIRANVTGGCPPYSYSWSNNASLNSPTQLVTLLKDTLFLTVTVTDKNGAQYSRIGTILPNNPRLTIMPPDTSIICNRGTTNITVGTSATDSAYWYQSSIANAFEFDFQGKTYTTPTLSTTRDFYVAAARSTADSVGKMNLTGTNVTTGTMPLAGLQFDVMEPVIIRDVQMYITGVTGATVSIGLLDKYGTIVAQLNNYAVSPLPGSVTLPTRIPLNFALPTPDTGYKIVLLGFSGLTGLTRHTTGFTYPFNTPANRPIIITKGYEVGNPASALTNYFYFYNIRLQKGVCVGQKERTTAKVTEPIVPKLFEDLKYTLLCKDDTLNIKVDTDTFGDRFVWSKNGIVLQNFSVSPPSDTFNDSFYRVPISGPSDTGLYKVQIFSTKFCTRDTFSREVRVSFHKEPEFTTNLAPVNICLNRNVKLAAVVNNASLFKWYKDTFNPIFGADTTKSEFTITNASFSETGVYHVVATDSNKCRDVKSFMVKVTVHDTPQFVSHPVDTVICVGQRYVIKSQPINSLTYQWYKDNGIMNNFIKDSLTLFSSLITDSGSYRLVASSYPGCPDAVSNPAKLTVNPSPAIQGFYPAQLKFCEGQKLKLTASAINRKEIEWYRGGTLVTVQDSVVIPTSGLSNAGKYSFIVKALNKCIDLKSDTIDVSIIKKPIVTGSRSNFVACQDTSFKFGFGTTNGKIYQWYRNGIALQSQIDSQLNLPFLSLKDTGIYNVRVNSDPVCPDTGSSSFRIIIRPKPQITLQPASQITACMGETIQLESNSDYGTGFQWIKDGSIIPGANNSILVINNLTGSNSGKYWLRINGQAPCQNIISDTAIVIHRSGQTNAMVSLVSAYNLEEQCTDGEDWTYYASAQEPNKYLFAVNKKGNNIVGSADIVVRPNTFVSVNNTGKQYTASLMLKRFWNYKLLAGTINNPIDVKFYVNQSELDDLDDKKDEIKNLYGDQLELQNSSVGWFKTKNVPFTNALLGGVRGNRFYFDSVIIGQYIDGTENGVKYIAFQDIADIGGGTAHYMFKGGTRYLGSIQSSNLGIYAEVSPNPNSGQFNLNIASKTLGDVDVVLVNNLGQTVYRNQLKLTNLNSEFPMMIPNLASGLYQLILSKDDFNTSIKLQIEK